MATSATTTKNPAAKPADAPSLTHVLKGTREDVAAYLKDLAGIVKAAPKSVKEPAGFVEQYYGVRESALVRRRSRALEFVAAAPRLKAPKVRVPFRAKGDSKPEVVEAA